MGQLTPGKAPIEAAQDCAEAAAREQGFDIFAPVLRKDRDTPAPDHPEPVQHAGEAVHTPVQAAEVQCAVVVPECDPLPVDGGPLAQQGTDRRRSRGGDFPHVRVSVIRLRPTAPAMIMPMNRILSADTCSPKATIPMTAMAAVPSPAQIA